MFYMKLLVRILTDYIRAIRYAFTSKEKRAGFTANRVVPLNPEHSGVSEVRVMGRHINGLDPMPTKFNRDQLVRIKNKSNGKTAYRFIKGGGSQYRDANALDANTIALDYDTAGKLGFRVKQAKEGVQLEVRVAYPWEEKEFYCFQYHSISEQIAHRDSIQGIWIGVIIGLIPYLWSL